MILDARNHDVDLGLSVQVAVIGAGPVGLTLARQLSRHLSVLVVESGGFEDDPEQADLQVGESIGIAYPLTETRARGFGGSTSLWAGYCAVFDRHDFEPRDWVPHSGWPFGFDHIWPYYAAAAKSLNLGSVQFDARTAGLGPPPGGLFASKDFLPTLWRFGDPTLRLAEQQSKQFTHRRGPAVLLNAAVVDIRLDNTHRRVSELSLRTLGGREGRVRAEVVILACGTIETTRLLLNSDTQLEGGIGNGADQVGRYFMEHPHISAPTIALVDAGPFATWTSRGRGRDGLEFMSCVGLAAEVQRTRRILNARAHVYRTPAMAIDETPRVGLFMEQSPCADSRITLSEQRDALGLRRVRLDWRLTDLDWESYAVSAELLGNEIERAHVGCVRPDLAPASRTDNEVMHSNHHLGATRMSREAETGVVDANCKVHGLENLYLAGGGLMPTVSWANPTLTVMALTHRLADHLSERWGVPKPADLSLAAYGAHHS